MADLSVLAKAFQQI